MEKRIVTRRELLDRWRGIQEEDENVSSKPSTQRLIRQKKESWFSDAFNFLINLSEESHIWCGYCDLMGPLLETFYRYLDDKCNDSPLKLLWKRICQEMGQCTQCICQHHQAQEVYSMEYELDTVGPLLNVLRNLDEERVTQHLREINARIARRQYDPEHHSAEVVSIMFEVLTFPALLDDQSLVGEFQIFIEAVDNSHELTLAGHQQYPGVYALLFLKSAKVRSIGLRLARHMGKLRRATDLEPLQPLLKKCIGVLETEVLPSTLDTSRPRVQLERLTVWLGIKALFEFLEPPAFEEGILERYPIFLSIVLNHVSDDTVEFTYAITCLRSIFEMLGCKLWLRTTLSPSVMRNTLLGQCFHTRNEKSHKEIFDIFEPFLQSLEALQDGEHEKQRRHFLYFLLHQVTQSSNFSFLMRKKACKIALQIIHRGYTMNPPCPPFECAHMWGPSLVSSLKDSSLHSSLRQPAFDLIDTIIVSDAAALMSLKLKVDDPQSIDLNIYADFNDDEDELPFISDTEEKKSSCWSEFNVQCRLTSRDCKEWMCIPMLWFDVLIVDPSALPISFSKSVFWALSRFSMVEPESNIEMKLSIKDWLSSHSGRLSEAFGWKVPSGSDDSGEGNGSKNSIDASTMCIPLIRTFKRFGAYFVTQMEQCELRKQWTWEPRMADSLILLLLDPNDNVRQVARLILEHFSKTRGLASGLQFLCSSAASLSALYLGLRYALKLVLLDSVLANFHNLHHLFFIIWKLVQEVGSSPQKAPSNPTDDLNCLKFSSEGGFLRQPQFDLSPVGVPGSQSSFVDMLLWDEFCRLLSAIVWPPTLKCLVEGKAFIDAKTSQMTCVRLLEILPVILQKLISSASELSKCSQTTLSNVFDFIWLQDLMDWGKSSLLVITRHWKQCVLSLLNLLKGSCDGVSMSIFGPIEMVISCDPVAVDQLKNQVSDLSFSLSRAMVSAIERKILQPKSSCFEGLSLERKHLLTNPLPCDDADVHELKRVLPSHQKPENHVIVLSDDEAEKVAPEDCVVLSSYKLDKKNMALAVDKRTISMADQRKPVGSASSMSLPEAFRCTKVAGSAGLSSQRRDYDASHNKLLPHKVSSSLGGSPTSPVDSKGLDAKKSEVSYAREINVSSPSQNKVDSTNKNTVDQTICPKISDQECPVGTSNSDVDLEKRDTAIEESMRNADNDPWERALKLAGRPQSLLTKPSVTVPKRRVIQLNMPMENKSSSLQRMDSMLKRFKSPRLDDWYRPILEIDYFSTVGLSSADKDENQTVSNFKEVPTCFRSPEHYVEIFRPLVLEEFKAQLRNSFMEISSTEDVFCGSLRVLSVERIDDFHHVRCIPDDRESAASRGFSENDLVLFTKLPLQKSAQNVHVVGKVERREKDNKSRSIILVIRFYFSISSLRLSKAKRLLMERSKWYVSRIMSITPQLREFQALSSLKDTPMLPIILNPVDKSHRITQMKNAELSKLSLPLQKILKSSFNDSQLQAISMAIGSDDCNRAMELSLIQGPPGTGKTRTIVAIVSALLALGASQKNGISDRQNSSSKPISTSCSNPRAKISQSAAIARAWQDMAFARQLIKNEESDSSGPMRGSLRRRVLICAQSNAAVDELVSRISNQGLYGGDGKMYKPYLVRVGNAKTVHPSSLPYFIDTLVEQRLAEEKMNDSDPRSDTTVHSSAILRSKLEKVVDSIHAYEAKRARIRDGNLDTKSSSEGGAPKKDDGMEMTDTAIGAKLNILYGQKKDICADLAAAQIREKKDSEESKALKHKLRKFILREAEIVVTTLSGSGGDLYGVCSESVCSQRFGNSSGQCLFDSVVIDEAAQALEPATLIPLQLLKSSGIKCIMVGDPKQLPATVLSSVASKFLYECSMFERLQRAGYPVVMLMEQYRMHPEISRFPSLHFYDNKLLDGKQMASKSAPFHESVFLGPYVFFDIIDGLEHHGRNTGSLSLYNESEADAAVEVVRFFKKRYPSEFSGGRLGIITPYKSQLSLLRSRFATAFGPGTMADIEFNTVDGFQGREVDILILSTVRSSDPNIKSPEINSSSIGFVADVRRMNVALTRARFSLWIVGNARTLQTNPNWTSLLKNAKERNLVISVARPYESIFRKHFSASKRHYSSNSLGFYSRDQKQVKKVNGKIQDFEQTRPTLKEAKEMKSKHVDSEAVKGMGKRRSDCGSIQTDRQNKGPENGTHPSGLRPQDHRHSNDANTTRNRRGLADCQGCQKEVDAEHGEISGTIHPCKEKAMSGKLRSKTIHADAHPEVSGGCRSMTPEVSKGEPESSKKGPLDDSSQRNSAVPWSSCNAGHQERQANTVGKFSILEDNPNNLIVSKKRQREAVDSLVPSTHISSKKPDMLLKSTSSSKSFSPSVAVRGVVKTPKPTQAQQTTSQVQERRSESSHSRNHHLQEAGDRTSSSSELDQQWKSFKDIISNSKGN